MAGKVRRIDYFPDEYISGVAGVLTAVEQGVYWMVCSLIMSHGGPVDYDDRRLSGLLRMRPADVRKVVDGLVSTGKLLLQNDGKLSQKRAESEVERSAKRIQSASENGAKGGRPAGKTKENQQSEKAGGYGDEKTNYQLTTNNQQPPTKKDSSDELSIERDAEFAEWYAVYPLHKGRGQALKAYRSARKKVDRETLLAGARDAAERYACCDARFIPHPATWLNGERWLDEPGASPQSPEQARLDEIYPPEIYGVLQ